MQNIAASTMLVQLEISIWQNQIMDKKLTDEVKTKHQIEANSDRYVKSLVSPTALAAVRTAGSTLRAKHNTLTMPWKDGGVRILPTSLFFKYRSEMETLKSAFDEAVSAFVSDYPRHIELAKKARKGTFDEADYPSFGGIRGYFGVRNSFMPIPASEDFRTNLDDAVMTDLREQLTKEVSGTIVQAQQNVVARVKERLDALYQRLVDPKAIFRDSTVENLTELLGLVPHLIAGDALPAMTRELLANIGDAFNSLEAEPLRTNLTHRAAVAEKIKMFTSALSG